MRATLTALCLLWIVAVGYAGLQSWPRLSLDMPARDPAVQAALARAQQAHAIRYGLIALGPPLILLAGAALWRRGLKDGKPHG